MLIERIKLGNVRGVGGSVLCALLVLPSLAAFVLAARKFGNVRLRNVPQVRLFGKIPFGSSSIWGFLIIAIGAGLCAGYFMNDQTESADFWVFLLVALPNLLTGILLTVYWAKYRSYRKLAERMLLGLAKSPWVDLNESVTIESLVWTPGQQKALLEELRDNDVLTFEEAGPTRYRVTLIHPELHGYFAEVRRKNPVETWNCPNCGAPNSTPAGMPCEYCGTVLQEKPDDKSEIPVDTVDYPVQVTMTVKIKQKL